MIAPPTFHVVRTRVLAAGAWLLVLAVAMLAMPTFAGTIEPPVTTCFVQRPAPFSDSTTAIFEFESTADTPEFWCALEGEEYEPCNNMHEERELPLGEHTLWVYSTDLSDTGRRYTIVTWTWTVVESLPPDAPGDDGTNLCGGAPGQDGGTPGDVDAGSPGDVDAGSPGEDAGSPGDVDAGSPGGTDAGTPGEDAGSPGDVDAGSPANDAGTPGNEDAGAPGGGTDAGSPGGDTDAGSPGDTDAGTPGDAEDAGTADGGGNGPDIPDDGPPPGQPPPGPSGDGVTPDSLDYLGGGVGCTGAPAPGAMAGLLLLVMALHRRRRR